MFVVVYSLIIAAGALFGFLSASIVGAIVGAFAACGVVGLVVGCYSIGDYAMEKRYSQTKVAQYDDETIVALIAFFFAGIAGLFGSWALGANEMHALVYGFAAMGLVILIIVAADEFRKMMIRRYNR
jgi:hypothetical protein